MSNSNILPTFKNKIILSVILFIIIITGVIYYLMYGSSEAKYNRSVNKAISLINNSNEKATSTYSYIEDGKEGLDKIKKALETSKKDLDSAVNIVKPLTPPDKLKLKHSNLLNGINSNKLLYIQSIASLDNYTSDTINSSTSTLYKYLSSTVGYYENFNAKKNKILLSKKFLDYPDKLTIYLSNIRKNESTLSAETNAKIVFLNDIKTNLNMINSIGSNVEKDITLTKNRKMSTKQLMISLSSNKNDLSSVIDKVDNLSSPNDLNELKTLFISTGVLYEDYLNTLRSSIESSKETDNISIVNSSINISSEKLKLFKTSEDNLLSLITEKEDSFR
ncbi:hypothetical protein [Clostridium cylindrosporum]|uniref:Uncharacterized protein n=1 Tax=Clostridium cylindrosporum DSM 605 TaxID=1121307 RepID=A0A0J8DA59_CLOCY|nr:hypothetical protein [Clostridium cylindrosporum]KMT21188.1 hypothetical protein CLCY_1c04220 [Clostridium cylindrosporum DSM 605]